MVAPENGWWRYGEALHQREEAEIRLRWARLDLQLARFFQQYNSDRKAKVQL